MVAYTAINLRCGYVGPLICLDIFCNVVWNPVGVGNFATLGVLAENTRAPDGRVNVASGLQVAESGQAEVFVAALPEGRGRHADCVVGLFAGVHAVLC